MVMFFWVCLSFCYVGPGIGHTNSVGWFAPPPYGSSEVIRFANGLHLDISTEHGFCPDSCLSPGTYWLVNLTEPVRQEWLVILRRTGLEPVSYFAYQNLVLRAVRTVPARFVSQLPFVRWLGPFRAEYKLAPEIVEFFDDSSVQSNPIKVVVCLWPGETPRQVMETVLAAAGDVCEQTSGTLWCRLPWSSLRNVANRDEVSWVQMQDSVCSFNAEAQWVLQSGWRAQIPDTILGRPAWVRNIRGQGMIAGLLDAGINTGHDMFRDPTVTLNGPGVFPQHRKIVAYKLYRNAGFGDFSTYHGSAVAATLAGDDSLCGNFSKCDGMAPKARIFLLDVGSAWGTYVFGEDLTEVLDSIRLAEGLSEPVRQMSGSVGSEARLGYYRLQEATLDAVAWKDKDFLMIWAAGNGGMGMYRLGHPSCAKNALTLGSCGNGTNSNLVSAFSSRGPTRDWRIKPDLVAPGQAITTAYGPSPSAYSARDGTSFSAPAANGALLLLRQYLKEGWYPSGRPDSSNSIPSPSSSLMRALAIVSADSNVGAETIPNYSVGWGRLNLRNILYFPGDSISLTFVDEETGLATGEYREYSIQVTEQSPLRVVLVWTDTAGAPEAMPAIVNDLNLELLSPDQNSYMGNRFAGGESRPNPQSPDSHNTVEVCVLKRPLVGTWTIRVKARNVFTAKQTYALAVRGSIAGLGGVAEDDNAAEFVGKSMVPTSIVCTPSRPLKLPISEAGRLVVYSSVGQMVTEIRCLSAGSVVWDGGAAPPGIYFLRFEPASTSLSAQSLASAPVRVLLVR